MVQIERGCRLVLVEWNAFWPGRPWVIGQRQKFIRLRSAHGSTVARPSVNRHLCCSQPFDDPGLEVRPVAVLANSEQGPLRSTGRLQPADLGWCADKALLALDAFVLAPAARGRNCAPISTCSTSAGVSSPLKMRAGREGAEVDRIARAPSQVGFAWAPNAPVGARSPRGHVRLQRVGAETHDWRSNRRRAKGIELSNNAKTRRRGLARQSRVSGDFL